MNIYLIRHGEAVRADAGKKDFDRELTPAGELKTKTAAANWKYFIDNFDYIISSPLVRAIQTANIIAEIYGMKAKVITDKKISPGSKSESIIEIANSLDCKDIAFVGHQPDLSEHLSNFISAKGASVEFKKSAIAKISFSSKARLAKGILEFLIPASAFSNHLSQDK